MKTIKTIIDIIKKGPVPFLPVILSAAKNLRDSSFHFVPFRMTFVALAYPFLSIKLDNVADIEIGKPLYTCTTLKASHYFSDIFFKTF